MRKRKRIGRRGPAGIKPRVNQRSEKQIALEQELQSVEKALMDTVFRQEVQALEARRAELLGEMKLLRE